VVVSSVALLLEVHVVPHHRQRYETVGDWEPGDPSHGVPHRITVSETGDDTTNVACALHELVEFWLCRLRGIPEEIVSAFDIEFDGEDPGADPEAPYHEEHMTATALELAFVAACRPYLTIKQYNANFDRVHDYITEVPLDAS
jgi:hypothetical protein